MKQWLKLTAIGAMITIFSACGSYYKVTDPVTEKTYYTDKVKDKREGAVVFQDAVSGKEVTLQNSEVVEIEKDEFKAKTNNLKLEKK